MERLLMQDLVAWKARANRKPLMLRGPRQAGKSWLLEEFGRREFTDTIRIDFLLDDAARAMFEQDLDPRRIVRAIELRAGREIDPEDTLVILDEIQEAPRGIVALKYFCEQAPEYHVAAAGSYLGIALRERRESFPVGKVDQLTLRPMCFEEFVRAMAGNPMANALHAAETALLAGQKDALERLLREYLAVGGMPAVVDAYAEGKDLSEVRRLQLEIAEDYSADFSKHAPARLFERMRLVWKSLPGQLARENKKFLYGAVRAGARARDFEESIQWLVDYGAVHKVRRARALRFPLAGYEDVSAFKLYCVDVGILGALAGLDMSVAVNGSSLFTEFKGALTEQYVQQELMSMGFTPCYWSSDTGAAEVDFAIELAGRVMPIEVKAGENLRAKSLRVAREKFGLERTVRTSLSGYRNEGWLVNIPLWEIGALRRLEGHEGGKEQV